MALGSDMLINRADRPAWLPETQEQFAKMDPLNQFYILEGWNVLTRVKKKIKTYLFEMAYVKIVL